MRCPSLLTQCIQSQMRSLWPLWPTQEMISKAEMWIHTFSRKNVSLAVLKQAKQILYQLPMADVYDLCQEKFVKTIYIRVHNLDTVQESLLFLFCIPQ